MGEGQEVLRREKKKLLFAFGCLESSFLEGQLKSDRCLDIYFKGCREAQVERQPWEGETIWRDLGEVGFFWCTVLKLEICQDTEFRKSLAILGVPSTCLARGHPAYNQRSQTRKNKAIQTGFHPSLKP